MTTKDALAEASNKAWNEDQRLSLRGAFTALDNFFKDMLLLKGKRATTVGTQGATLECSIECNFKPRTVLVLSCVDSAGLTFALPPIAWAWSANPRGGTITFSDPGGLLGGMTSGGVTFDVFMERS